MEKQRAAARKPTLAAAHILVNTSPAPIDCYIRDATDNGARLRLMNEKTVLPKGFRLKMPGGRIETVEVVWQAGASVGVRFLSQW